MREQNLILRETSDIAEKKNNYQAKFPKTWNLTQNKFGVKQVPTTTPIFHLQWLPIQV